MQTAPELGIKRLYRYQPFNIEWLRQIINDNTIYFSNPSGFNDPWDCRPHFYSDVDDQKIRAAVISYFFKAYKKHHPDGGRSDVDQYISQLDRNPDQLRKYLQDFSEGFEREIDRYYKVYCLTTKPTCPLMWGHYATKHSGICLEFEVQNEVFCGALKVEYAEEYPSYELTDDSVSGNVRILTTKSTDWAYEDEYRLVALESSENHSESGMLSTKRNVLTIPDNALSSIIVGCMMAEKDIMAIDELIRNSGKSIGLKKAVRFPNKYGLSIQEIR